MSHKVLYTTHDGRFQVELEYDAKNQVGFFEALASFQEVFEFNTCHTRDGKHTSDNVQFVVRENAGNVYYEAVCRDPNPKLRRAKKQFGQHKGKQTLFPKRYDNGSEWAQWDGQKEVEI